MNHIFILTGKLILVFLIARGYVLSPIKIKNITF